MFQKILVANRGEIAVRIIRAARALGVPTVAVFSTADREALHVRMADERVCIGPPSVEESYLNIPAIIGAAMTFKADAIHPGYGFLSENGDFAEACLSSGIGFIGPRVRSIRLMGDKPRARRIVSRAEIPVLPGSEGPVADADEAKRFAREIGYPVLLKAAAGGGGRGLRIARSDADLLRVLSVAQAEGEASFGNGQVYVEKYLERARHIEFQILGDHHKHTIHLGERDCSIQRRYQKVIEEAPSPALDEDLRERMGRVAIRAAQAVGYNNVGTVEFLLAPDRTFYFIEMNTRVQVEHPVT
ncbi:MAG: biotin carboxylase N-terminal domain-containing protein, partial [Candidatus Binatia bacterium]